MPVLSEISLLTAGDTEQAGWDSEGISLVPVLAYTAPSLLPSPGDSFVPVLLYSICAATQQMWTRELLWLLLSQVVFQQTRFPDPAHCWNDQAGVQRWMLFKLVLILLL